MIDSLKVEWIRPESYKELTKWRTLENVAINGTYIPAGFITDSGSIPYLFRRNVNPVGQGFIAYVSHDWKCEAKGYPRLQADQELLRDLIDSGMNKNRARLVYWAVRSYARIKGLK